MPVLNAIERRFYMDISAETLVSRTVLADILGITVRRTNQLVSEGVLDKRDGGLYELGPSVQSYIRFKGSDAVTEADLAVARAKAKAEADLKTAKSNIATLEAAELEGKMHRSEDVAAMTEDLIYTIRGALMALPGRLAVDVAAVSTPVEAQLVIKREVYKVMRELASYRYDAARYEERVRDRMNWDSMEDDGE